MKKFFAPVLAGILLCGVLTACGVEPGDYAVNLGVEQVIEGEDSVKVLSAQVQEGTMTVVLDADFETIKLSDFEKIAVRRSEVDAPDITCDTLRSRELNGTEIFYRPCRGRITLVFSGEQFTEEHQLEDYALYLEYQREDGTAVSYRFLLG